MLLTAPDSVALLRAAAGVSAALKHDVEDQRLSGLQGADDHCSSRCGRLKRSGGLRAESVERLPFLRGQRLSGIAGQKGDCLTGCSEKMAVIRTCPVVAGSSIH